MIHTTLLSESAAYFVSSLFTKNNLSITVNKGKTEIHNGKYLGFRHAPSQSIRRRVTVRDIRVVTTKPEK